MADRMIPDDEWAAAEAELAGDAVRVRTDPLWWTTDGSTLKGWLLAELLLELDRAIATEVDGPALYGSGLNPDGTLAGGLGVDFDVILVPFKTWTAVPLREPTPLLGILDSEGITRHG